MSDAPEKDQKTEDPTPKRKSEAVRKGDVLQSRELGTALVIIAGAAWIALAGPMLMGALETMLKTGLTIDANAIRNFDPFGTFGKLIAIVAIPLVILFGLTLAAAIGTPAALGSLGFRSEAIAFKGAKVNPLSGMKRIFSVRGLIELVKSLAKVILLGAVGIWLLLDQARSLIGLTSQDLKRAIGHVGDTFLLAVIVMAFALALIALIDVPAQMYQRTSRLKMSKQEVKDEAKQTDGSPEMKGAIKRRQMEVLRGGARAAVAEATVVLTNPTHFAVALRYDTERDAAPVVVARGRGATAEAIRELAKEHGVPLLSYPQLARAIYFTTRTGQMVREDLYLAVATVLAFVFNLDATVGAAAAPQPPVNVPKGARFDERGMPEV